MGTREKISACITCCDEESNIRRCLESVRWADEIIVVDSYSKDATLAICRDYTDRIYQHKWLGYIGQKNLIKEMAQGPWILFVDADEEVSAELRDEIVREFDANENRKVNGYEFPRMVFYMGQWIRHGEWYPDLKMRLFRKDLGICAGSEPHDRTTVPEPVKRLKGHLYHYTYESMTDQIETLNDFARISAKTMFATGKKFAWSDLIFRPGIRFFKAYFLKRGLMDGMIGFIIAVSSAFGVFLKYAKLFEMYRYSDGKDTKPR